MTRDIMDAYAARLSQAANLSDTPTRAKKLDNILFAMRRDDKVPHLRLCAFLQDNAKIIKENQL